MLTTLEQNGECERANRTFVEEAREVQIVQVYI